MTRWLWLPFSIAVVALGILASVEAVGLMALSRFRWPIAPSLRSPVLMRDAVWLAFENDLPTRVEPMWATDLFQRPLSSGHAAASQVAKLHYVGIRGGRAAIARVALTVWITRLWSANEMSEYLIERLYVGRGCFGMRAGAEAFFGRLIEDASVDEVALLAGLLQSPSRLWNRPDAARERRDWILRRMHGASSIDGVSLEAALKRPLPQAFDVPKAATRRVCSSVVADEPIH